MTHKISRNQLHRTALVFSVLLLIIASAVAVAQQPARKIARIEFEGLQRLTPAEAVASSGLKVGEPFSLEAVDAAGERLANSGLFGKVAYRTRTTGNSVAIVFKVEETKGGSSPVVFDNFVWFTRDELYDAIKRDLPSFNGTAPDAGTMTDTIKTVLQNLLKERKIPGTVEYSPWQTGNKQEHLFSVSGVPIPICALHFPGAKNVAEEKLVKSSKELTDADYSTKSAIAFGGLILYPIYREAGQLKAKFGQAVAKLENTPACSNGVDLTIPVEEGPIYLWDKAEWSGYEALSADDLSFALGMKNGEVANGKKFDRGIIKVQIAYGRKGHLDARVKEAEPVMDDAASRVSYKLSVVEGPQYKMGNLIIKGLSGDDTKALEEVWKLKYGSVLDTGYLDTFLNIDGRDVLQKLYLARLGKEQPRIEHKFEPKLQTLTADVILEFKY